MCDKKPTPEERQAEARAAGCTVTIEEHPFHCWRVEPCPVCKGADKDCPECEGYNSVTYFYPDGWESFKKKVEPAIQPLASAGTLTEEQAQAFIEMAVGPKLQAAIGDAVIVCSLCGTRWPAFAEERFWRRHHGPVCWARRLWRRIARRPAAPFLSISRTFDWPPQDGGPSDKE